MQVYDFSITIDPYVEDLDLIDSFYGKFDDVSVAGSEGKTIIHFDREADSLDEALRCAIADIRAEGWQACAILVEPECICQ